VPEADPATFKPLERSYAKDARRVYYFSQKKITVVEGADASTFEVTFYDSATGTEAKDKTARYMEGRRK
ncbi:MAG TPA: DKNYY domain-containing protein, partial [Elusimicrobiota bacterium]|nr:DKNYY domain-containing protein [Elusimicrobiota bacterium]